MTIFTVLSLQYIFSYFVFKAEMYVYLFIIILVKNIESNISITALKLTQTTCVRTRN